MGIKYSNMVHFGLKHPFKDILNHIKAEIALQSDIKKIAKTNQTKPTYPSIHLSIQKKNKQQTNISSFVCYIYLHSSPILCFPCVSYGGIVIKCLLSVRYMFHLMLIRIANKYIVQVQHTDIHIRPKSSNKSYYYL